MGAGWIVVSSKPEDRSAQPRPTKIAEGNPEGAIFGYGEGGVVVAVVGPSNAGLRWVVKAVGVACSRRVAL